MAKGGARPGAGRKPGSKSITLREMLAAKSKKDKKDYEAEFLDFLLANYMEDSKLMIWMGDHIWGKAPQALDLTSGGETLSVTFDPTFNASTRKAKGNSK